MTDAIPALAEAYVCPQCHSALEPGGSELNCSKCEMGFPVQDGIVDFSGGKYFDCFNPGDPIHPSAVEAFEDEETGTRVRIAEFYLPRLRERQSRLVTVGEPFRVLDCGCGNGLSVDLLEDAGFLAWGNDLSLLRKWQWSQRRGKERLSVCSGSQLPFPGHFFDAVIAAGVYEHVGVTENAGPTYTVSPTPDQDAARHAFIAELLRVVSSDGVIWMDFPNGGFPIDFWHITPGSGARWHSRNERFLPTIGEIREHLGGLGGEFRARALSPAGRLSMRRVRRRWFGKLLYVPVTVFFSALRLPFVRRLGAPASTPTSCSKSRGKSDLYRARRIRTLLTICWV